MTTTPMHDQEPRNHEHPGRRDHDAKALDKKAGVMALELPKGLSRAEQETVVRWDEEEKLVTIWSASPVVMRKLHALGLVPHRESRRRTGELWGREFKVPLAHFRWRVRAPRQLSETERQALRRRLSSKTAPENRAPDGSIRPQQG